MSEQLLVRFYKNRTGLGKCYTHLYDRTQGSNETRTLSTENCLLQVQEDRLIMIKKKKKKKKKQAKKKTGANVKNNNNNNNNKKPPPTTKNNSN